MNCQVCNAPLTGRQRMYCSRLCKRRRWREENPEREREHNLKRHEAKLAWARAHYTGECEICGTTTTHRYTHRCPEHSSQRLRCQENAEWIVQFWAEGISTREIADRLGWTTNHLRVEMARLRKKGYDLPHRRPYYGNGRDRAAA